MKRIFTLASLISAFVTASFAQGEMNAFNLSYNDLTGTARSVGMGGAFGALGGDISGIAINPAGIGIYKSNEIVTTLNFTNLKTKTDLGGVKTDDSKFRFMFDNLAFVGSIPINSDEVPFLNFGVSYNKVKSFNRKISMAGTFINRPFENSLSSYIADVISPSEGIKGIPTGDLALSSKPFTDGADYWYGAFGYNSKIVKPQSNQNDSYYSALQDLSNPSIDNDLQLEEKGEISSYDLNFGTTISDMISLGVTVSVTDINYHLFSSYGEYWFQGDNKYGDYFFENWLKTEGTGWQVKAGAIFKPIHELRIGVAYHSPTWYNMTDYYRSLIDVQTPEFKDYISSAVELNGDAITDYKLRTPDKWVFSLAGVIGNYAIISADYELTNYSKMSLKNYYSGDYNYSNENADIESDFRNSSILRLGAEVRFTPQFSGRIGYMWQQSPVKDTLKDGSESGTYPAATAGTVPHYSLVGDANNFTWGLGYRFTPSFYTDIAFVIKTRTDDLYNFGGADKAELKNNQFSGLMTLGYRF